MLKLSVFSRFKHIGASTLLIFSLLTLAMGSVAYGLSYLVRDLAFSPLLFISIGGLLLSWLLARTKIPGWVAGLLLFVIGAILTFFWVGDLWESFKTILSSLDDLLRQFLNPADGFSGGIDFFWSSLRELIVRTYNLLLELDLWLRPMIAGQPIYNYAANSLIWGFAIWLVSTWAGWFQRRIENPLVAILPAGLLLTISLGYTYGRTAALYPLIFAVLLLTATTFYYQRERSWKTRNMDFPEEERSEKFFITFGIVMVFLVFTAVVSQISIDWMVGAIRELVAPGVEQIDPLFDSFGLEGDSSHAGYVGKVIVGGLPREHLIGSGPELSDQIVMSVQLEDDLSGGTLSIQELQKLAIPLYWRGITYDRYTGYGWESSDVVQRNYNAEEPANHHYGKAYQILSQTIRFVESNDLIYAAGEIFSLDTDYSIAWRNVPDTTEMLNLPGDFFAGSQNTLGFQVDSLVPIVSEEALHTAQNLYPAWVLERYLALPDSVPRRVFDLARAVTRNSPTSFGKASAIEAYLRTYKYELNLPAPPKNRELSDYFLFELQKGYCDYYATAMVVMARAIGVPARIAIGYTHGNYDSVQKQYIVSEENAHSWVEIYFAEIGWIPFEPTPAQPPLQRPGNGDDIAFDEDPSLGITIQNPSSKRLPDQWWFWFGCILTGIIFLFLIWPFMDNRYLKWLSPSKMTINLYKRLLHFGSKIGSPYRMGDTPYEFAVILGIQIRAITQYSRWESYLRPAVEDLQSISHSYVYSIFSPYCLSKEETRRTLLLWKRLKGKLLLINILYVWYRWLKR